MEASKETTKSKLALFKYEDGATGVALDGLVVPYLTVEDAPENLSDKPGRKMLVLDGRLIYYVDPNNLDQIVSLVADAMAVARGYSEFGKKLRPMDEFGVLVKGLTKRAPVGKEKEAEQVQVEG